VILQNQAEEFKGKDYVPLSRGYVSMDIEERISKIERISVRIAALGLLILALSALLFYGVYELVSFVYHLIYR
jgi:hypothetical protein